MVENSLTPYSNTPVSQNRLINIKVNPKSNRLRIATAGSPFHSDNPKSIYLLIKINSQSKMVLCFTLKLLPEVKIIIEPAFIYQLLVFS